MLFLLLLFLKKAIIYFSCVFYLHTHTVKIATNLNDIKHLHFYRMIMGAKIPNVVLVEDLVSHVRFSYLYWGEHPSYKNPPYINCTTQYYGFERQQKQCSYYIICFGT